MALVERDRELAALHEQWRAAVLGRGGLVVVSGEAGAGKTSLVQHFTEHLADGVRVLWGACDPLDTPRPLGPFHDMAGGFAPHTARKLREARNPHDMFAAICDDLREQPSLLVVDDLHWADQGTIDLLRFMLRRIESTGSLAIGTVRDDELGVDHPVRTLLGDAARSPRATTVSLAPLSVEAIGLLAAGRAVDAVSVRERSGGNAFFVSELLTHEGGELPATIRDAILARTAGLSSDAWDLLHLLVCAPEAIPDQLLGRLGVGFPPLRTLNEIGLIRRGARGVAFRHDLCRLAVASVMPPGVEPELHARLLAALESAGADPAVLAHHAIGAGDAAAILRHAADAGRAAARSGAHTQAAEFFERALHRAVAAPAADRAELLEAVATEYYLIDRLADAIAASTRALRLRDEAGDHRGVSANHHALAVYHWYNAERAAAEDHARAAVAAFGGADGISDSERAVLGHAFAMQAFLAMHSSDLAAARGLIADARRTADGAAADPTIGVRIDLIGGLLGVVEGDAASRAGVVRVLDRAGDDYDDVYSSGYSNLGFLDVEQRRFDDAATLLERSIAMSIERDLPICRAWQTGARGRLKLLTGEWDAALTDADEVLTARSAPLARFWPHLERAVVGLRRHGDPGRDLDAAWALAGRYGEVLRRLHAAAAVAEFTWLTGEDDGRLAECRNLLTGQWRPGVEWARGELAVWLRRLGHATDDVTGVAEPYALELAGDVLGAAAAWASIGAPFERALALAHARDPDSSRAAVDTLDRLGADAVAAKVRRMLRTHGITSVPARRRAATREHPVGLTARQEDVLRHMSDGLTNAELAEVLYISPKTVDHHVSAILTKLGVASRREAVRAARALGLLD